MWQPGEQLGKNEKSLYIQNHGFAREAAKAKIYLFVSKKLLFRTGNRTGKIM